MTVPARLSLVTLGVADVERAAKFYDAALAALGYKRVAQYLPYAIAYGTAAPAFWIQLPHNQQAATVGNAARCKHEHIGARAANASTIAGTNGIVERPPSPCPPASVPCATTTSAPTSTAWKACSSVLTWQIMGTPAFLMRLA